MKGISVQFPIMPINLFSSIGNEGLAPAMTGPYRKYDSGAVVFPLYGSFRGTSIG